MSAIENRCETNCALVPRTQRSAPWRCAAEPGAISPHCTVLPWVRLCAATRRALQRVRDTRVGGGDAPCSVVASWDRRRRRRPAWDESGPIYLTVFDVKRPTFFLAQRSNPGCHRGGILDCSHGDLVCQGRRSAFCSIAASFSSRPLGLSDGARRSRQGRPGGPPRSGLTLTRASTPSGFGGRADAGG